jgi:hypothetical protein
MINISKITHTERILFGLVLFAIMIAPSLPRGTLDFLNNTIGRIIVIFCILILSVYGKVELALVLSLAWLIISLEADRDHITRTFRPLRHRESFTGYQDNLDDN